MGSNYCQNIVAILAIVAIFSRESQGSTNILTTFVAGGGEVLLVVKAQEDICLTWLKRSQETSATLNLT